MWLVFAISAACIWGLDYVLAERIFHYKISPITLIVFQMVTGLLIFLSVGYRFNLKNDLVVMFSDKTLLLLTIAAALTFNFANLLIFLSIQARNATLAALIELSYPIFTILFAWVLFHENHLTMSVFVGGILIFLGIGVIAVFS